MNEPDDKIAAHLNAFSIPALHVVVAARYKAGQRGAKQIEVGDLLIGIVLEDNGMVGNLLSEMHGEQRSVLPLPSHIPFVPPKAVGELLSRIENLLPQSDPIGHTIEVPLSPDIEHIFDGAKDVQSTFHHQKIQPLHLLAAVLTQNSGQFVTLLNEVGITKTQVLERLNASDS
jgi:ATP-dependent Clp protease ATP-binding subunit ClpA